MYYLETVTLEFEKTIAVFEISALEFFKFQSFM